MFAICGRNSTCEIGKYFVLMLCNLILMHLSLLVGEACVFWCSVISLLYTYHYLWVRLVCFGALSFYPYAPIITCGWGWYILMHCHPILMHLSLLICEAGVFWCTVISSLCTYHYFWVRLVCFGALLPSSLCTYHYLFVRRVWWFLARFVVKIFILHVYPWEDNTSASICPTPVVLIQFDAPASMSYQFSTQDYYIHYGSPI